ncbi:Pyranose dehydrogenase 1 [Cytospora mali]|uniref:Pyranose dehydrogenase 1 n=1 Tax=Cytospora mali TaxID=578113 RepID=A0A194VLT7_CYTMA|nr:Pyranose dehydrogenase 1 [Valsa mali]
MKFDYVVVGGGTCGLLVANRLSEDPNTTVVVIEPGQDARNNPNVTDPANFLVPFNTPIDWAYPTISQPGAANRSLTFHSGKAIGGTSTINGLTYFRSDAAEIDAWEALGNAGWNWETLFPYYKKVERFTRPTTAQVASGAHYEPQYHGEDGDLHVGYRYALSNGSFHGLLVSLGIHTVIDLAGVGENLQEQPNSESLLSLSNNLKVAGATTYSTFGTVEDIFGSNKSVIAASTNESLARYAQLVASASHDGVNATALEQIFRVLYDLLFSKNVAISETITDYNSGNLLSVWWCLIPLSRGSVHLGSAQLIDEPGD